MGLRNYRVCCPGHAIRPRHDKTEQESSEQCLGMAAGKMRRLEVEGVV